MGYDAVSTGKYSPMFRGKFLLPSESMEFKIILWTWR
jgi:hypothetical protein